MTQLFTNAELVTMWHKGEGRKHITKLIKERAKDVNDLKRLEPNKYSIYRSINDYQIYGSLYGTSIMDVRKKIYQKLSKIALTVDSDDIGFEIQVRCGNSPTRLIHVIILCNNQVFEFFNFYTFNYDDYQNIFEAIEKTIQSLSLIN